MPIGNQDCCPLEHLLQLPHIAGPEVCVQHLLRFSVQAQSGSSSRQAPQKKNTQLQNVAGSLGKRSQANGKGTKPKKQICAESAPFYRRRQIQVCGGHYPHIHSRGFSTPQALNFFLFQKAQQLRFGH